MVKQNYLSLVGSDNVNIFLVNAENNGRYPNAHSLLIKTNEHNNSAILFDSGVGHRVVENLVKDIRITKVFLSHWHEDHISGNFILKRFPTDFYGHPLDIPILKDISIFQLLYDTMGSSVEGFFRELLKSMMIENLTSIGEIVDSQNVSISESLKIKVLHTPGHSAGHCCFYEPESKLVFLADIDLSGLGPWYGCLDSNIDDFEDSIKKLMDLDLEYAISSHKGVITGKSEIQNKFQNYLQIIYQREDKILTELSHVTPKSIPDLVGKHIIYKNYNTPMKEYLHIAEGQMITKHMIRLEKKNKVVKMKNGYLIS